MRTERPNRIKVARPRNAEENQCSAVCHSDLQFRRCSPKQAQRTSQHYLSRAETRSKPVLGCTKGRGDCNNNAPQGAKMRLNGLILSASWPIGPIDHKAG